MAAISLPPTLQMSYKCGPYWHARFALPKVNGAPKNGVGRRARWLKRFALVFQFANEWRRGGGGDKGLKSGGGPGRRVLLARHLLFVLDNRLGREGDGLCPVLCRVLQSKNLKRGKSFWDTPFPTITH